MCVNAVVDIVKNLHEKNVCDRNNVHWLKQLRYYNEEQTAYVRMFQATLSYGYEYLGNFHRLIITPETERSYRYTLLF